MKQSLCEHLDFDWINPYGSDNELDEVLACTECGWVKWTAREIEASNGCCKPSEEENNA